MAGERVTRIAAADVFGTDIEVCFDVGKPQFVDIKFDLEVLERSLRILTKVAAKARRSLSSEQASEVVPERVTNLSIAAADSRGGVVLSFEGEDGMRYQFEVGHEECLNLVRKTDSVLAAHPAGPLT